MKYVLDTNTLSFAMAGDPSVRISNLEVENWRLRPAEHEPRD